MKKWITNHRFGTTVILLITLALNLIGVRRIFAQKISVNIDNSSVSYIVAKNKKLEYRYNTEVVDSLIKQINGTYSWEKKVSLLFPQSGVSVHYIEFYDREGRCIERVGYVDETTVAADRWLGYVRYRKEEGSVNLGPFLSYIEQNGRSLPELNDKEGLDQK